MMKNIVLAFNYHDKKKYGYVSDDFDTPETIETIKKAIEKRGCKVYLVEADESFYPKINKLKKENKVDLVFNYSLGLRGPSRQAHIPAMLEMLDIPYTGCDAATVCLRQNKGRAKEVLEFNKIKTANFQVFYSDDEKISSKLHYPLIVKCLYEDSSIGLGASGVVTGVHDLKKRIRDIMAKFKQPVLVEEYIKGREFTVGVFGNWPKLQFLPPLEILPNDKNNKLWIWDRGPKFIGDDLSKIEEFKNEYGLFYVCPVRNLNPRLKKKMESIVRRIFYVFSARDHIRVDFRVKGNTPYVLEVNNCSHLAHNGSIVYTAQVAGMSFEDLINEFIDSAKARYRREHRDGF